MDIEEKNRRIFEDARDHLNQADLKNSEQFDKAILSLSSAGLALSISFSKFIVPPNIAECIILLKLSWLLFGLAIVSTVISFVTTSIAINFTRDHIYKYYIENNESYANKTNLGRIASFWLNKFSALVFILGIITTVLYVNQNIHINNEAEMTAKSDNNNEQKGYVPPKNEPKQTSTSNNQSGQQQSTSTNKSSNK